VLRISAALLGGTPEYWRRAAPTFSKAGTGVLTPSNISSSSLLAVLRYNDRDLGQQITLRVKVRSKASYKGLIIDPADVRTPAEHTHPLEKE
jgi:hypothetical protein